MSLSAEDKVKIARELDALGIHYIEGGWPGSNPKDAEFFQRIQQVKLRQAKVAAFGSTRHAKSACPEDANIRALVEAHTPVVTLVGKSSTLHVEKVLETTLDENLRMIGDSVAYFKRLGKEVVYDAEHFFDGYKLDSEYAVETIAAAAQAGADWIVLCDTNGGSLPEEVALAVRTVREHLKMNLQEDQETGRQADNGRRASSPRLPVAMSPALGIHTHNDGALAVANA